MSNEQFTRYRGAGVKLALCQMQMSMSKEENLTKTLCHMDEARLQQADLIFFPEVQLTPFFAKYPAAMLEGIGIQKDAFAVKEDSDVIEKIRNKAKECSLYCSPNLYVETEEGKLYDRSYFIDQAGNVMGHSDMVNIFSAENFYEKDYYAPSEDGYQVYDTPFGRVGIVICFDRHIGESVRSCALQGAQLVLIPTANLKSEPMDLFLAEVRTLAYQNNVFLAMCNRVGQEDDLEFAGESVVVGPDGEVIAQADDSEQILYVDIDPGEAIRSRNKRPYIGYVTPSPKVYHMAGQAEETNLPQMHVLFEKMAEYDKGDAMRIQHFTKVWQYARMIGIEEGLPGNQQNILEVAAIVHDIGIHKAEKSFGSSDGKLQEKLGPGEALTLLTDLGYPRSLIERVIFLVGHHHTYSEIDGLDYQILVEADFLVNGYEDGLGQEALDSAYEKIFKTSAGKRLFRLFYPEEGQYSAKTKR